MYPKKLKLVTVVGTRPEIIRLSRTMALLDKYLDQVIVHTGQNYDYELNEIFWKDLELRKPNYLLTLNTSTVGSVISEIIFKTEEILIKEKPDCFLVLGDTNSCLAAYVAKRMHIPIFHMEAGNRCFDANVPEEVNRKIIDHIADFNLVYTEHARRHLISEGYPQRRIYLTGSPMKEVLDYYESKVKTSEILADLNLTKNKYILFSTHREENVDNPANLNKLVVILNEIYQYFKIPIIVSTHPRTRKRLENTDTSLLNDNIRFLKPFGYFDYLKLQTNALITLSDSGTISEESSILNFPALSIRESMERPEAQDTGSIILTGLDHFVVINSIIATLEEKKSNSPHNYPNDYNVNNTSWRVLKLILGNSKLSNKWNGIN